MPLVVSRRSGEVQASAISPQQRESLWAVVVRSYLEKHPEVLTEKEEVNCNGKSFESE